MTVKELMQHYRRQIDALTVELKNVGSNVQGEISPEQAESFRTDRWTIIIKRDVLYKVLSDLERVK